MSTAPPSKIELLASLPEAHPDITVVLDCGPRLRWMNASARTWLASRGLVAPEGIYELYPRGFGESTCRVCDRATPRDLESQVDGRTYSVRMRPFAGKDRCMAVFTDVTEHRRAGAERELFYRVIQSVLHAVILTDPQGVITHVNPAFERLYGYAAAEVIGRKPNALNPGRSVYRELGFPDGHYDELFAGLWKSITDPSIASWEGRVVNRARDGRLMRVRLTISSLRGTDGAILSYIGIPFDVTREYSEERGVRYQLYRTIASVAEIRDNDTGRHMQRVGVFSRILALAMGLSAGFAGDIEVFAPLHDIGKVGIPDSILHLHGPLTEHGLAIMREHTAFGHNILMGKEDLVMADDIAWRHHERFDGGGYPGGLSGAEIPLAARIASVADVYDAMRSARPYKPACSHEEAVRAIAQCSGTRFDPDVVAAFGRVAEDLRAIYEHPDYTDAVAAAGGHRITPL